MVKINHYIKFYKYITNAGLAATVILLLLTLNLLIPINFKSETAVATGDSTSTTSLTLDVASSTAGVELLVASSDGTFASTPSGSELSFSVSTNNYTGYKLSLKSTSSDTRLSSTSVDKDNNKTISYFESIASATTEPTFKSSNNLNGHYGIKPSCYKSSPNTSYYYPAPDTAGVILNQTTSASDTNCTNNGKYAIALGVRADYTQPAGTYSNTFILTAIGNYPEYTINYIDSMTNTTLSTTSSSNISTPSVNIILANAPTKDGYDFGGWCTVNNSTDLTACKDSTGTTGTTYAASATYPLTLATATANVVNFYTIWQLACDSMVSGTMQGFNPCSNLADGTSGSLTDSRDNQIYTVKKINSQWWMTRNLAIGCNGSGSKYGSRVSSKTLTSSNSNVSTTWSTPTALLSAASSSTSTNDYSTGRMQCSSTYGAWYNYAASSAGTVASAHTTVRASYSICPLNWKIPTGPNTTSNTDINKLVGGRGSGWQTSDGLSAFGAVAGGRYNEGSLEYTGYGFWWSATSTAKYDTQRYYLQYSSNISEFVGDGGSARYGGLYVRCVHD